MHKRIPISFKEFQEGFHGGTADEALLWLNNHFKNFTDIESIEWNRITLEDRQRIAAYYFAHRSRK